MREKVLFLQQQFANGMGMGKEKKEEAGGDVAMKLSKLGPLSEKQLDDFEKQ